MLTISREKASRLVKVSLFSFDIFKSSLVHLTVDIVIGAGGLGIGSRPVKSDAVPPTARHRWIVSAEMCCPNAKPQR